MDQDEKVVMVSRMFKLSEIVAKKLKMYAVKAGMTQNEVIFRAVCSYMIDNPIETEEEELRRLSQDGS